MSQLSTTDAAKFALAGKAILTIVSRKTGERFTYKISRSKDRSAPDGGGDRPVVWFVKVLCGSDNTSDYRYVGFIRDEQFIHGGRKAFAGKDAPSVVAFAWFARRVIFAQPGDMPASNQIDVFHEGKCGCCGRRLTVPASIVSGIGPECAKHYGAAPAPRSNVIALPAPQRWVLCREHAHGRHMRAGDYISCPNRAEQGPGPIECEDCSTNALRAAGAL